MRLSICFIGISHQNLQNAMPWFSAKLDGTNTLHVSMRSCECNLQIYHPMTFKGLVENHGRSWLVRQPFYTN